MTGWSRAAAGVAAAATVSVFLVTGYIFGATMRPLVHDRMFPWIVARASGIGAFVAITVVCISGLAFRRPVRPYAHTRPETYLRLHTALGFAVVALVAVHIASLLLDRWSGVHWPAVFVPDGSSYRPAAVTWGCVATYLLAVSFLAAGLAGRSPVGRRWRWPHRAAYLAFAVTLVHGLLAGSDTAALRGLYVAAGGAFLTAFLYRAGRKGLRRQPAW